MEAYLLTSGYDGYSEKSNGYPFTRLGNNLVRPMVREFSTNTIHGVHRPKEEGKMVKTKKNPW